MPSKHEANAALCRALGVEPIPPPNLLPHVSEFGKPCKLCNAKWFDGFWASPCAENKIYPDLTSADALMAALDKAGHDYEMDSTRGWKSARLLAFDSRMEGRTVADALFLAACAAFGIEASNAE